MSSLSSKQVHNNDNNSTSNLQTPLVQSYNSTKQSSSTNSLSALKTIFIILTALDAVFVSILLAVFIVSFLGIMLIIPLWIPVWGLSFASLYFLTSRLVNNKIKFQVFLPCYVLLLLWQFGIPWLSIAKHIQANYTRHASSMQESLSSKINYSIYLPEYYIIKHTFLYDLKSGGVVIDFGLDDFIEGNTSALHKRFGSCIPVYPINDHETFKTHTCTVAGTSPKGNKIIKIHDDTGVLDYQGNPLGIIEAYAVDVSGTTVIFGKCSNEECNSSDTAHAMKTADSLKKYPTSDFRQKIRSARTD